jgi:hypothetical protein
MIRKELAAFLAAIHRAVHSGLLDNTFPTKGLVVPKALQKSVIRTRAVIVRSTAAGGLKGEENEDLWNSRYLALRNRKTAPRTVS